MTENRTPERTRPVRNEPTPPGDEGRSKTRREQRIPPNNIDAERNLLGAAMLSPVALEVLVTKTRPEDFYAPAHAAIAGMMADAFDEGWQPDPVTLWDRVQRAGLDGSISIADLSAIVSEAPSTTGAPKYAEIVHDHATLRRLLGTGSEIAELAYSLPEDAHAAVLKASELLEHVASQNGRRNLSTLDVADVATLLESDLEPEEPDFLTRTDGRSLFYAGKMHVLQAEPSSGKTWIALLAALEVLGIGGSVVYLDYEDSARGILGRLLALGAEPAHVRDRFAYMQPAGAFGPTEKLELGRLLEKMNPDLVVIDGVAEALARDGLSEDRASEVVGWIERLPRWISRTGAAVVMLDHVAKDKESQGRWARGSGAKLGAVDGASYQVKVTSSFSRSKAGTMKLVVAKDRPGGVGAIGDVAAIATIDPKADGARVVVTLDPNTAELAVGDSFRPTVLMERASRALEESKVPLTAKSLRTLIQGKPNVVTGAIARLLSEGWIAESTGKPKTLRVVTPFRQEAEAPPPPEPPPSLPLDDRRGDDPSNVVQGPWTDPDGTPEKF
jgi:hypothetical protein